MWQPGTDHAGIATQMVVERQLEADGKSRHDLGRDAFIERIWGGAESQGGSITRQLRRLGSSWTGGMNALPWMTGFQCGERGFHPAARRGSDLPRQTPGQLGSKLHTAVLPILRF